jgi:ABC-type transporter Mla subunit MlaD
MEAEPMQPPTATPIHGYSRAEVDDFLSAAAAERARLEATIADANTRASRARSALGTHRVMVAMLLETQRELGQMRSDAEKEAEAIISAAERDVAHARSIRRDTQEIDLSAFAAAGERASGDEPSPFAPPEPTMPDEPLTSEPLNGSGNGDEYFAFLRGALDDDQPLGPLPG